MKIGIVCYPTFGGSGVVATELGKALADGASNSLCYLQPAGPARFFFRKPFLPRGIGIAIPFV
jgi:hypothetical protein